jgi:glycogen(starch) synthase
VRVLLISNFYPPHYLGGYELGCYEVAEALKRRGHQAQVLTSNYGLKQPEGDGVVNRWLQASIGQNLYLISDLLRKELHNRRALTRAVADFRPEVIYIWNLWQVSLSLAYAAEEMAIPVSYYVFDHWLARWGWDDSWFCWWAYIPPHPVRRLIKRALGAFFSSVGLRTQVAIPGLQHVQFASEFLKQSALQSGKPVESAEVIPWGVDTNRFPLRRTLPGNAKRLLFVGQLIPHKGAHTAIEALRLLLDSCDDSAIELTVVGGTVLPDYEQQLKWLVRSLGVEDRVHFAGHLSREQLPDVYQEHDILIVPSIWDEPFGMVLLEAMSSGLAVVGTATGGSAEILHDGVNGLVFPKEDAQACAAQISCLLANRELFERIRLEGRRTAEQKFPIERTVDRIEQALQEAITSYGK